MFDVKVDLRAFERSVIRTDRAIADIMREETVRAANTGAKWARTNFRHTRRTGKLTSQAMLYARLDYAIDKRAQAEIVNVTPYARFVEYPTKPHIIRPKAGFGFVGPLKRGQSRRAETDIGTHRVALRWYVGGKAVFARSVRHPGTRGFAFMRPALGVAGRELDSGLRSRLRDLQRFWK